MASVYLWITAAWRHITVIYMFLKNNIRIHLTRWTHSFRNAIRRWTFKGKKAAVIFYCQFHCCGSFVSLSQTLIIHLLTTLNFSRQPLWEQHYNDRSLLLLQSSNYIICMKHLTAHICNVCWNGTVYVTLMCWQYPSVLLHAVQCTLYELLLWL